MQVGGEDDSAAVQRSHFVLLVFTYLLPVGVFTKDFFTCFQFSEINFQRLPVSDGRQTKSVAHRLREKNFCEFIFVTPLYKMRLAGRKTRVVTQTKDNHVSGDTIAKFLDRGFHEQCS